MNDLSETAIIRTSQRPKLTDWQIAKKVATFSAASSVIKSLKPAKTPGENDIFPALFQKGSTILIPHLVRLFRASLAWNYIPTRWTEMRVLYILKLGKIPFLIPFVQLD